MKHVILVVLVVLYVIVWAQNWTWFAGALMLRAVVRDRRAALASPGS